MDIKIGKQKRGAIKSLRTRHKRERTTHHLLLVGPPSVGVRHYIREDLSAPTRGAGTGGP